MARRPLPRPRKPARQPLGHRPVEAYLRRRWRGHVVGLMLFAVVLLVLVVLDHSVVGLHAGDDLRKYDGQSFEVVRVVDGDTVVLRVSDGDKPTTLVRVWGVDTPELARRDGSEPAEPLAAEATELVRELLVGGRVTLRLEPHRLRGGYGRLLAHLELPDGVQLGAALIQAGLSEHDERWGHRHLAEYELLEVAARAKGVGLWER